MTLHDITCGLHALILNNYNILVITCHYTHYMHYMLFTYQLHNSSVAITWHFTLGLHAGCKIIVISGYLQGNYGSTLVPPISESGGTSFT